VYNSDNNSGDVIALFNKFRAIDTLRFVMEITIASEITLIVFQRLCLNGDNILETPVSFGGKGEKYYSSFKIGLSKKSTDKLYGLFLDI
jgi:hypothetical protein